jgi:hypothetical protein
MRKTLTLLSLTLVFLALMDIGVAQVLAWGERSGRLGSLVQYFDYGRSVPGKLAQWEKNPGMPDNLYDVAWRPEAIEGSRAAFLAEPADTPPVIRSYGMSFVNNILRKALEIEPELIWDGHAGPGAPPNFTYALFEQDRANRRESDIVILGILSSAVPAMAALSNSTWVFEQPAPFTYPIYWPEGDGLRSVEPLVSSAAEQRALSNNPAAQTAWHAQLMQEDHFFGLQTFGLPVLDASPFARLVRRALAISHIERTNADILQRNGYPYAEVLRRMISAFARQARADGQMPVVMLIQSRDPRDPNLLAINRPVLDEENIPYLATADYFDPEDQSGFLGDGHYRPPIDRIFAERFIDLIHR